MKSYQIKRGKDELYSTGGNYLCGLLIRNESILHIPLNFSLRRRDAISDRDVLLTQIGMICNSRNDFNDVELYRDDCLFKDSFGIDRVPSESVLRQRLDEMPADAINKASSEINIALLKKRSFGSVRVGNNYWVPLDMDVSPFDNSGSHKQGVAFTYKKHDGYAPIFAYVGTEGYMLECELRPGNQHCQKDAPDFIKRVVDSAESLGLKGKCLIRLDSGHDAKDNFDCFGEERFIVKRNLRQESPEQWLALARRVGNKQESREGKNVYTGYVDHFRPGNDPERPCVPVVFEVTERLIDHDGNYLLKPELKVSTYWTNLSCEANEVIDSYHDHGTSEQFHSELKSDLGVERLPSGKLCVNKIILRCAMVAFNVLRSLGQEAIASKNLAPVSITVKRWRLKTVLQNLIYCAVKRVRHAKTMTLRVGRKCPWFEVFKDISQQVA